MNHFPIMVHRGYPLVSPVCHHTHTKCSLLFRMIPQTTLKRNKTNDRLVTRKTFVMNGLNG